MLCSSCLFPCGCTHVSQSVCVYGNSSHGQSASPAECPLHDRRSRGRYVHHGDVVRESLCSPHPSSSSLGKVIADVLIHCFMIMNSTEMSGEIFLRTVPILKQEFRTPGTPMSLFIGFICDY